MNSDSIASYAKPNAGSSPTSIAYCNREQFLTIKAYIKQSLTTKAHIKQSLTIKAYIKQSLTIKANIKQFLTTKAYIKQITLQFEKQSVSKTS